MRQQIVAGNWKMNKTLEEGLELTRNILEKVEKPKGLVVVAPPLTHLRGSLLGSLQSPRNPLRLDILVSSIRSWRWC